MSKYEPLWIYIRENRTADFSMSFDEIVKMLGFKIDHSFLTHKKELVEYGYEVFKISMKEKTVNFKKIC